MSTKLANLALHCYILNQLLAGQQRVFKWKSAVGWGVTMEDYLGSYVSVPNARNK